MRFLIVGHGQVIRWEDSRDFALEVVDDPSWSAEEVSAWLDALDVAFWTINRPGEVLIEWEQHPLYKFWTSPAITELLTKHSTAFCLPALLADTKLRDSLEPDQAAVVVDKPGPADREFFVALFDRASDQIFIATAEELNRLPVARINPKEES